MEGEVARDITTLGFKADADRTDEPRSLFIGLVKMITSRKNTEGNTIEENSSSGHRGKLSDQR
jgi:hypothetical protein